MNPTPARPLFLSIIPLALLTLSACSNSRSDDPMANLSSGRAASPPRPGRTADRGTPDTDLRPAIVVSGRAIPWDDVWEPLAEYGGGIVVAEVVLDSMLEAEIARQGLTVSPADAEAERVALTRTIAQTVGVPDAQAQQLAQQVTRARALGPSRMASLLRRNAMLRALARTTVNPSEDAIRRAYDIEHGRRYVARLITMQNQRDLSALRDTLTLGDPASLRARFSESAVASSTDPSGAAGGLLGPVSPSDTALPAPLRDALAATPPGTLSHVLALPSAFGLVYIESVIEPDGVPFDAVRPALEASVRDRAERLQMDVIAQEMLSAAPVTIFDRSLNWGWENSRAR